MIVAFTGHRPERLGDNMSRAEQAIVKYLEEKRPSKVISGMARGVDLFAFTHSIRLGIPAVAALPWFGHGSNWPDEHKKAFYELLEKAAHVEVCSDVEEYKPWIYDARDRWMVDNSEELEAVWDGVASGGTYNTIKYAEKVGRS